MKTVLILGATSDVGKSIAEEYSREKCELILAGRNLSQVQKVAQDLRIRFGNTVNSLELDITDFSSHQEFVANLPVFPNITVCLIGYLGDQGKAQSNWENAEEIISANYTGVVSIINLLANRYEQIRSGSIAVFSSVAGERGRQSNYLYGSAKAGLNAYLSGLRNRLFLANIHVLTIKPGFIDTRMTENLSLPKPLTASPAEVAKATVKAIKRKRNVIYIYPIWKLIMWVIRNIPEKIFKRLKL
jgi:short-subunit dehydrogenase